MTKDMMTLWLRGLGYEAEPVVVKLGKENYEGAVYNSKFGDKRIELIGPRPKKIKNRRAICFIYNDEVWYISHYYDGNEKTKSHPFGAQFGLCQWTAKEPIDSGKEFEYLKVPMEFHYESK